MSTFPESDYEPDYENDVEFFYNSPSDIALYDEAIFIDNIKSEVELFSGRSMTIKEEIEQTIKGLKKFTSKNNFKGNAINVLNPTWKNLL
uniref:Uncharacterized protein n=1 Tax=Strongyloides papillosus TaxID=174720 RepID=A0A0N5CCN5_STREA